LTAWHVVALASGGTASPGGWLNEIRDEMRGLHLARRLSIRAVSCGFRCRSLFDMLPFVRNASISLRADETI